jgi:hypothetical protein
MFGKGNARSVMLMFDKQGRYMGMLVRPKPASADFMAGVVKLARGFVALLEHSIRLRRRTKQLVGPEPRS